TLPRRPWTDKGRSPGVLNQRWLPTNSGAAPRAGSDDRFAAGEAAEESNRGCPLISASRRSTADVLSRPFAGSTANDGKWLARAVWKRTSRLAAISPAVTIRTTPTARWSRGPRAADLTPAASRRPPSVSTSSTAAVPALYATASAMISTELPRVTPTETTAARIGPAQGA